MENFKIITEKENPLFNRKEIQASVEAEITPSSEDVKTLISEKFSVQAGSIKIKKISGKFGSKVFTIVANIYKSKEDKDKTEPKSKKKETKKTAEETPEAQSEQKSENKEVEQAIEKENKEAAEKINKQPE